MHKEQIAELLYQALETEEGGVKIYETALKCAQNEDLREEWEEYLEHTREHVEIVREAMEAFGLDPSVESPGRLVVRHIGESLVEAMQMALDSGLPDAAQIVATECVVLAETKDHLNWELIGMTAEKLKGDEGKALKDAYVTRWRTRRTSTSTTPPAGAASCGWMSLGMPAVLPPPEEEKDVKTAVGAARAKAARKPSKKK